MGGGSLSYEIIQVELCQIPKFTMKQEEIHEDSEESIISPSMKHVNYQNTKKVYSISLMDPWQLLTIDLTI